MVFTTDIFNAAGKRTNVEDRMYNFNKRASFEIKALGAERIKRAKDITSNTRRDKIKANGKVGKRTKTKQTRITHRLQRFH